MPGAADPAELLYLEMHELTRMLALVAVGRLGQGQPRALAQPDAPEDRRHRRERRPQHLGDLRRDHVQPAELLDHPLALRRVRCGIDLGAEERSTRPDSPSVRQRASHRYAVRSTKNRRLFGQVRARASPCSFIRVLLGTGWLEHLPASKEARMSTDERPSELHLE